jgi:glycosyltransferase involved in cell wall biosynthesis
VNSQIRCLFIYKEEYPWDVRVEKLITTLAGAGYNVSLLCRNLDGKPSYEVSDLFDIKRLPAFRTLPLWARKATSIALWFNPIWLLSIFKIAMELRPQLIIVRDLPLMMAGILAARLFGAKIIFDMAECYPEMYQSSQDIGGRKFGIDWLKSPLLAKLNERVAVRMSDQVFVMVEESRARLAREYNCVKNVAIISNTPVLADNKITARTHDGEELRLIYVGFVTPLRGLDNLIRGVAAYCRQNATADIQLDIVGQGESSDELSKLVSALGLASVIRLHGWLDHDRVAELMGAANVGALTYRICGHWNHTIPNKIFDYMLWGLPVLATGVVPIVRVLEGANCGVICEDGNSDDVGRQLELLADPLYRQTLGDNGRHAVETRYNWSIEAARMLDAVNKLCEPQRYDER